jgi:quinol monooxygenase YgiN
LTRCRYKDKASIEVHGKTDHYKNMGGAFKEEDLLAEPIKVMFTKEAGGYASRL